MDTRRAFLSSAGLGFGAMALRALGAAAPRRAKARRVLFLYMAGGPSHLDLFDPKPRLAAMDGKPMPESFTKGKPIAQLQGARLTCLGPRFEFARHGRSGQPISSILPWTAKLADKLAVIRSMRTDQINHDPAHTVMNTGTGVPGKPSLGAWVSYGLGRLTDDLPAFVVLTSEGGRSPQPISTRQWGAGFLPGHHQGVLFRSKGDPALYLRRPAGTTEQQQRDIVGAVGALDRLRLAETQDAETASRIAQYETAFRMQTSVPGLMDVSKEPARVLERYGTKGGDGSFAANCLLARRLLERGTRFVQLYHRGWDHHGDLVRYMKTSCGLTDKPTWALLTDLEERGLLADTLVVWGGEFGRTPMFQGKGKEAGRDHHIRGFTMWLAGAGIKGGTSHGATDELGYEAVEDVVDVRDLHATMLHLLGLDHERLAVRHQGLDQRLTGVEKADVVRGVLA
ncbi:MAG: DUF1501 domain-containing protein [Gemmataceae bacterium]|nr:DUF1501 domain-containing protein [Gemmataceae bacterium]